MNAKFCFLVVGREMPSRLEKKGALLDGGQRNLGTGGDVLGRGDGFGLGPGPHSGFRGQRDRSRGAGWSEHSLNLVVSIFPFCLPFPLQVVSYVSAGRWLSM